MKKNKVVQNIPTRLPIASTVLYLHLMYYYDASDVLKGVFITILAIFWALVILAKYGQEKVDVFAEDKHNGAPSNAPKKSKFQERLERMREESRQ